MSRGRFIGVTHSLCLLQHFSPTLTHCYTSHLPIQYIECGLDNAPSMFLIICNLLCVLVYAEGGHNSIASVRAESCRRRALELEKSSHSSRRFKFHNHGEGPFHFISYLRHYEDTMPNADTEVIRASWLAWHSESWLSLMTFALASRSWVNALDCETSNFAKVCFQLYRALCRDI